MENWLTVELKYRSTNEAENRDPASSGVFERKLKGIASIGQQTAQVIEGAKLLKSQ